MSDDRPSVYTDDGITVYRASAIGSCINTLVATRLGFGSVSWPESTEQVMAEGNLHEPDIVRRLEEDHGYTFERTGDGQLEVELQITPRVVIRCHPDGINDKRVLEAKSMSVDVYKKWTAAHDWTTSTRYAYQHSIEMLATGLPGLFVCKNRNNGQLDVLEVDDPPFTLNDIRKRVLTVEALAKSGEQGLFKRLCDGVKFPCPVFYLHPEKTDQEAVVASADTVLDGLAKMYADAREEADRAVAKKDAARSRIMSHLGEQTKVRTVGWQITRSIRTRKSLDREALSKVVQLDQFERVTEYPQLTVTEVKDIE